MKLSRHLLAILAGCMIGCTAPERDGFERGDKVIYVGQYKRWWNDSCDINVIATQATEKHNMVWTLLKDCDYFYDNAGNPRTMEFDAEDLIKDTRE